MSTGRPLNRTAERALGGHGHAIALPLALCLAWLVAAPVLAHSELVSSDPANKAVLAVPPTAVTLTFSEDLAANSSFKLIGGDTTIGTGHVSDKTTLVLDDLALAPGDYEVQWTSVATDGDILRGVLTFSVVESTAPPATATPAAPSASDAPTAVATVPAPSTPGAPSQAAAPSPGASTATGDQAASSSGDVVLPIVVALVAVAAVGAYLLRRSRSA